MSEDIDFSKYYTIREAALYCDVSASAVRNWILTGRLPAPKASGRCMIHEDDLRRITEERKDAAEQKAVS